MTIKPTWENTFNGELRARKWGNIGYAIDCAQSADYPFLLWEGKIYALSEITARPTEWTKTDLYR